jgi:hypothetical protein
MRQRRALQCFACRPCHSSGEQRNRTGGDRHCGKIAAVAPIGYADRFDLLQIGHHFGHGIGCGKESVARTPSSSTITRLRAPDNIGNLRPRDLHHVAGRVAVPFFESGQNAGTGIFWREVWR